jgi:hypothetical protein
MAMDVVTLGGSIVEMIGALLVIYMLRKQPRRMVIGLGGSLFLLGLTLIGIAYGQIAGMIVWIPTGIALVLAVGFSYLALRRPQGPQPSDA